MRIVLDQDEVLAQFVVKVLDRWNNENGTSFTRDQVNMWHLGATLGVSRSGESTESWLNRLMAEPGFFSDLKPVDGALDGINKLLDDHNHDIVIATSISDGIKNAYDGKTEWIKKNIPGFKMQNFMTISRKGLIDGDMLIDDGVHNIENWLKHNRKRPVVFDAPWNRDYNPPHPVIRIVGNWRDVLDIIDMITYTTRGNS